MCALNEGIDCLLSLPPKMAASFCSLVGQNWFVTSDPPGGKIGSGGGTAHLVVEAWRQTSEGTPFRKWLGERRKLIVHGSGESRRLPAYAAEGKPLMPIPVFRWARGQRLNQTLVDLQLPVLQRILAHAPPSAAALIASGDVLLRFGHDLPDFPEVDVLSLGMWVRPETAKDFGVFFVPRQDSSQLAFLLQKPSAARIRELGADYLYLVDTGVWLLSARALEVLLKRCGWDSERQIFTSGTAEGYELYSQFGLALGRSPTVQDELVNRLTCGVVPLPQPEFYHFGTSRQLIESVSALQNVELDERKLGLAGARRHPDQYVQNAAFHCPLRRDENHTLWVENSTVPSSWKLACAHVLTGIPDNQWDLQLEPGVCLDCVPVAEGRWCFRFYGLDDAFRGVIEDPATAWLDQPALGWFEARGLALTDAGIAPGTDIFSCPLFPVLDPQRVNPRFLEWLFSKRPVRSLEFRRQWIESTRLSSRVIQEQVDLSRLRAQRAANRNRCLKPMLQNSRWSVFFNLDLESTAELYASSGQDLPVMQSVAGLDPMRQAREQIFRAAVLRHRRAVGWQQQEAQAFSHLREMIAREAELQPSQPRCTVQEDQIVWGRSPIRLDLAGGWTDTPPYCLENGGTVVNFAASLNGQPPIQAFAKLSAVPELVMRSIDLGVEQRVKTYEELACFAQAGSEFAIAKAALALAGFLPRFHTAGGSASLRAQLEQFGGGIEISLLCAVPKGSGLGTSSLLAATVLATVGNLCGLNWDQDTLFSRTLALEQLITTGGGWQDQIGGLYHGVKLIETEPGLKQKPTLRWLPNDLFGREAANHTVLLYYTGLTRLAKGILNEIVRAVFLNSPAQLGILEEIRANAYSVYSALQRLDVEGLAQGIRTSWDLNQRLDAGTNPPAVQKILRQVHDYVAAAKLLGAGGGGYLLMLAKDEQAAMQIRGTLQADPPNARARFVNFELSGTGLELTRS